jgi:VWFA-related protein
MNVRVELHRTLVLLCLALFFSTRSSAQQVNESPDTLPRLEVNVIRVLVPVVVRDKQGRVVTDLTKEDFQVFDNDKPRPVSAFTVEKRRTAESNAESGVQPPPPPIAVPQSFGLPERSIVFLFDDLHLSAEDMALAKNAAAKVLAGALSSSDIAAVVSLSGKTNSGLIRDQVKLQEAIMSLQPRGIVQGDNGCPNVSYYQADLIENKHDSEATADVVRQVFDCNPGLDVKYNYNEAQTLAESAARRVLNLGRQDVQTTYASIAEFVRRVSTLPGQRMLVLISPGFLPIEQESRTAESRIMDLAAKSNVTISALDARGLYTTELNANERSPSFTTVLSGGGSMQLQSGYRRMSMNMAEDAMGELADGTGGAFFHNSNDLAAGFKALTEPPECVYLLELALGDAKPDGAYHRLKVKVDRDGLELQARRGYFLLQPLSPATDLSVNGEEIRLDLVVLDKKNKPILDLKPQDIAVTDDDSPVALDNLHLVAGKEKRDHLLTLIFDQPGPVKDLRQAIDPSAVNQPRDVAARILKIFPESGFSFSVLDVQGRLQLQHGFTSDRKALAQAIEAATQPAESASGLAASRQEQELAAVARTGADASGTAVSANDRALARALFSALNNAGRIVQDQHLQPSLAALLALVQSQQQFAERKAIIYFSSFGDKQADSRAMDAIQSVVGAANRAGITIYVVDFNRIDDRAAKTEASGMSMALPSDAEAGAGASADLTAKREAANSVFQHLAEGTGGSYIVAEDDLSKPAKQVIQDMTTYYEASYLPSIAEYDGKFRSIAVKPLRTGISIRSQAGYLALPARAGVSLQPFELPLLKILSEPKLPTDLIFHAAILHMEDVPEGSVNTLAIEVPLSSLNIQQDLSTNLYSAHVSIVADVKDNSGAVVAHFSEDIPRRAVLTDVERTKFEAITLQRHFIAPPGSYVLEAAIFDRNSNKAGAQRMPFEIPGASGAPSLSEIVLVRKTEPFRAGEDTSEPMQHGNDKVVPNLSGQLPLGAKDFAMFFIAHVDPNAPEPAMLGIQVLKDGKPMEDAPIVYQQARKARFSSYLAHLSVDPPKDGLYEVKAILTQGKKSAEARAEFTLAGVQPAGPDTSAAANVSSGPNASDSPAAPGPANAPDPHAAPAPAIPPASPGRLLITFPANPAQPPAPEELKSILEDASRNAMEYSHSLPNLMCEQVTNRSVDPKSTGQFRHKDKLTELLTYVDHEEARTLLVMDRNGARHHKDTGDTGGAISAGEFGGVLEGVFRPLSKTDFQWKEAGALGDGTVQVFDYRVARANSIMDVGAGTTTYVGCHGQVFIDGATRGVRRITMVADDVPKNSRVQAASVSVDYDYVAINNHDFLLPVSAQIIVSHDGHETDLNQIQFRNFHRFSSTARILDDYKEATQ